MTKSTRELALCGLMTSLSVVLMWFGGVIAIGIYACPMLASLALIAVRDECRRSYAWCCYAASAILALLLVPDKECSMLYLVLGYYPLIYPMLQKLRPAALRYTVKFLIFAAAVTAMYAVLFFIIAVPDLADELALGAGILTVLTALIGAFAFFVYDKALERLTLVYAGYKAKHSKVGSFNR